MSKQSLLTRIKSNARNRDNNAAATMALILESFDVFAQHGDWTNLAWIVSLAQGSDASRLKAIIEASGGVTFKVDKKQPTGLRIAAKGEAETNRVNILAAYVELGVSFRSAVLETGVEGKLPALLSKPEAKARTPEEIILAAVRKIKRDCGDAATKARITAALSTALKAEF